MKYFSMFSGIGGFEYGIHNAFRIKAKRDANNPSNLSDNSIDVLQAGRQCACCVGFSEIDKYAKQIYKKQFGENDEDKSDRECGERTRSAECVRPNGDCTNSAGESWEGNESNNSTNNGGHKDYGDCTKIKWEKVEDFDCLVGGFPCQAFSIAGKRGGFSDTRGTLFFEIARCLREKQPRLCVLENVKGLLSHDKGATFFTIISTLDELGYDCQWQVLNSKNFGVPQNRERVFIIGHLRGTSRPEIFPIGRNDGMAYQEGKIANTLTANYCKGPAASRTLIKESQKLPDAQRIREIDGCSVTLKGEGGGQGAKTGLYAIPVLTPDRKEKRQNERRFKNDGDPAFTCTAQDRHGIFDGYKIRRLTPTECERLQGFPDGWTEGISDTQRYKCLGNAVTTNVIHAIFNELFKERQRDD